jgi:hypothetical protein
MVMGGTRHVARVGEKRISYNFLVEKSERRQSGRPRCRWEDNIKTDLKMVGNVGLDLFGLE